LRFFVIAHLFKLYPLKLRGFTTQLSEIINHENTLRSLFILIIWYFWFSTHTIPCSS